MDNFEYLVRVAEMDTLTTLKAKEQFIREQVAAINEIDGMDSWSHYVNDSNVAAVIPRYKLLTKALNLYDGANDLPDKLLKVKRRLCASLLTRSVEQKHNYPDFVNFFEFDAELNFGGMQGGDAISVILMIGTEVPIQKVELTLHAPYRLQYVFNDILTDRDNYSLKNILAVEDLKAALHNREDLTMLNQLIDKAYSDLNKRSLPADLSKVPINLERLNTISAAMMAKLCP